MGCCSSCVYMMTFVLDEKRPPTKLCLHALQVPTTLTAAKYL